MDRDVSIIKGLFDGILKTKTEVFIESLKNKILRDIFSEVSKKNQQKLYLDEEIGYLMDHQLKDNLQINKNLKESYSVKKKEYSAEINATRDNFEKIRDNHLEVYNQEFCFKLNGDSNLVSNTLMNAIPFLKNKNKKLDDKLVYLQSKNTRQNMRKLELEIEQLGKTIRKLKA